MKTNKFDTRNFQKEAKLINEIYKDANFRMPIRYVLTLTNDCNLSCPFCFMEKVKPENAMNIDDWIKVIDQLPDYARVILFGGEPLFYKDFDKIYKYVAERFKCTIVTNGTLLNEKIIDLLLSKNGLHELAVSIDMIGNSNRGFTTKQWSSLIKYIKLFNKKRKKLANPPELGIDGVILDENAHNLYDLNKFLKEDLECNNLTFCLLNGTETQLTDRMRSFEEIYEQESPPLYKNWSIIKEQIEEIRQYDKKNNKKTYLRPKIIDLNTDDSISALDILNKAELKKTLYAPCKMPWSDCRVYSDGNVSSCLSVSYGNFKKTPNLKSILTSETSLRFRKELKENSFFEKCNRCVFLYDKKFEGK